jgi:urease accessory protein
MTSVKDRLAKADPGVRVARALQFGDSMFPIGAFVFSGGLESAIQKGVVHDADTLRDYTRTAMEQANRGDGIALVWAHRAAAADDLDRLLAIDGSVYERKLSSEARTMSVRMGRKSAELGIALLDSPLLRRFFKRLDTNATPGCYPVTLATTFAVLGLPALEAFVVHQYGVAASILGAALRLMRIDHIATQKILFELNADAESSFRVAAATDFLEMSGFAPLAEILAEVHVRSQVRLFMS